MTEIVKSDMINLFSLYEKLSNDASSTTEFVSNLFGRLRDGQLNVSKGNSLLQTRNDILIDYLMHLVNFALLKIDGQKIENDKTIDNLVELRTYIEKITPIYSKLKYQIDKIVASVTKGIDQNDPLNLKPCPENILSEDAEDESEDNDHESEDLDDIDQAPKNKDDIRDNKSSKNPAKKIYVPPKISEVKFEDDVADKKAKALERAKKRAIFSDVIQELKREFDDGPEEVKSGSFIKRKSDKIDKKTCHEEEYLIRLRSTKQERKKQRSDLLLMTNLGEDVTRFENISALDINDPEEYNEKKNKRGKKKVNSVNKKKKFKKRK